MAICWLTLAGLLLSAELLPLRAQRCYLCSNSELADVVRNIQDERWRSWLGTALSEPRTPVCEDPFQPGEALRAGAKSQLCEEGACVKLSVREKTSAALVWRSCLPDAAAHVRSDCTMVTTSAGELEICTCTGNLCNAASRRTAGLLGIGLLFIIGW